jgi:hypothetical protein
LKVAIKREVRLAMTIEGTIHKGTVVLDNGAAIPDGTRVTVFVRESGGSVPTFRNLLDLAGTVNDLPSDMALNHDHYLHGHPKR